MSIIHDALKKVQAQTPGQPAVKQPQPTGPSIQPQATPALTPDDTRRSLTILMAAVLTVAVIVILAVLFKVATDTTQHPGPMTPAVTPVQTPVQTPAQAPTQAPTQAAVPKPQPPRKPAAPLTPAYNGLRIEGIMDMNGKKIALINGNVYEEGQTVNSCLIEAITLESVTIIENGIKKVLPTKP